MPRWDVAISSLIAFGYLASAAVPSGPMEFREGRLLKTLVVAADELSIRDRDGEWHLESVSPGDLTSARARLAGLSREVSLVLYPPGAERNESNRRVLSSSVIVETRPGIDAEVLPTRVEGGARNLIPAFSRRFAVYVADDSFGAVELARTLRNIPGVATAHPELGRHHVLDFRPNDTFFNLQWHLEADESRNGGTAGIDVGVVPAWDNYHGEGLVIAVVDDGIEATHPDLAANIRSDLGYDYLDGDSDPSPRTSSNGHGTCVAGLVAGVGNNSLGIAGVAYQSKLAAIRMIDTGPQTDAKLASALSHRPDAIHIRNNSWGPPKAFEDLADYSSLVHEAIDKGIADGREGRGVIFVFSAGNYGVEGDNVNYAALRNRPDVIPVGAVGITGEKATYSTPGAPLLVSTPGGNLGSRTSRGILTTDRVGAGGFNYGSVENRFDLNYTQFFNGTSAAAPLLSGVVALMLQANPNLGWRDVQELLIRTATKNSPQDSDWKTNGAGFGFNHSFGAGLAHAGRATALAKTWKNLPPQIRRSRQAAGLGLAIPDNNTNGLVHELTFSGSPIRVEQVLVTLDIAHPSRGELTVTLISPSGMQSRLAERHKDTNADYPSWTFTSRRHWGESSEGTWKVRVADGVSGKTGTLKNVLIELLGASQETLTFAGNTLLETAGQSNGNGGADPGESLAEVVSLRNASGSDLAGVTATFSTMTPGVTLLNPIVQYPTLLADRTGAVQLRYAVAKTVACGTVIQFTQQVTSGTDRVTNAFSRTLSTALSTLRSTNVWEGRELIPLALPDLTLNQATNHVTAPGDPVIESIQVAARINHPTIGDLEISIIHPDQTEVPLMLHRGGDNPDLGSGACGPGGQRAIFSDAAALAIKSGTVPFSGAFRPEQPLSVFQGKHPNGAWVLRIADTFDEDSGTLLCWSLTTVTRSTTTECVIYNLGPTVVPLTLNTDFNTTTNGQFQGLDGDGDPITFTLATLPAHGTVELGLLGAFTYTPNIGYSGPDSFTYKAHDGYTDSPAATVAVTVKPPPAPPSLLLGPASLTADHRFRLVYQPSDNRPVSLEMSVDLLKWTQVNVFTSGGATEYIEPVPTSGMKFYRLR